MSEEKNEKFELIDVLKAIMTTNVDLDNAEYKKLLEDVATNYDKLNEEENKKRPTLRERRERIRANYYGTSINFLFQILHTVNDFYRNYAPLIEAIAEKVGVEFEKIESEEEKAMKAAAEYLRAGAEKRMAEAELAKKQALNREQRRKLEKENK